MTAVLLRGFDGVKQPPVVTLPTAAAMNQNGTTTWFTDNDGAVIAEFPTKVVERIQWVEDGSVTSECEGQSAAVSKNQRANSYASWSTEEDAQLKAEESAGQTISEMAKAHERSYGAIRARLVKLGLRS